MRKLISSTIIILPLLLLAVLLVSGAVVGFLTHIYVENIEFSDMDTIVLVMKDMEHPPEYDLGEEVTVLPTKATNQELIYTNYDEKLLTINEGIIKPVFYGETYITVQSKENKAATATRKVIVTDTTVHALKFNFGDDYKGDMYEGDSQQLSVSIYPQEANEKGIIWSSSNDSILHVSSNGTVKALGNGEVTITATAVDDTNGVIQATTTINCHAKLRGMDFDDSPFETSLVEAKFPEIITNPTACDVRYEYVSDKPEIATVDKTGKITFSQAGKVTITVTVRDYSGKEIKKSKEFISTCGYFWGPLFDKHDIDFEDCKSGQALNIRFAESQSNSYRLIQSLECGVDSNTEFDVGLNELISYDQATRQFILSDELPPFNKYLYVKVHATIYDDENDTLNATYEDYFFILKSALDENVNVSMDGTELQTETDNVIDFSNIGESITLQIDNPDNFIVQTTRNTDVSVIIDGNTIKITSLKVPRQADSSITLYIGTKTYVLKFNIQARAEYLEVSCAEKVLDDNESYNTLLDSLTFEIDKKRGDGQPVASEVKYQINVEGDWHTVDGTSFTIDTTTAKTIHLVCDDAEFTFTVQKEALEDFGIEPFFTDASGGKQNLNFIESVVGSGSLKFTLPENVQDSITLELSFDVDSYLGGLGSTVEFKKLFPVDLKELEKQGWSVDYSVYSMQIIIEFAGTEFNETITLSYEDIDVPIQIMKVNIQEISFINSKESFDSKNEDDVRKGFQQVRVFAKHSYYGGKIVDYFRIPLKALSSVAEKTKAPASTITWTLSRFVDDAKVEVLTSQFGDTVIIGGEEYKIVLDGADYVLKNSSGEIVSGKGGENKAGYIWIDAYTEETEGYARIYFGNFGGLSESDVYNDYFGNFEELENWEKAEKPTDDKKGRIIVEPSENAFAFMKIEAGDGVVGGENCYFNFNVLADSADKKLINVFDADGYYENDNIVLHTDLYGPGEIERNDGNSSLFLDRVVTDKSRENKLSKTTIYGNGYQINLMARNTYLLEHTDPSKYGYHNGAAFYGIYNLVLKGSNPTSEIKRANQAMVFRIGNAYYCDIQYLAKINSFYDDAVGDGGREQIGSFSNIKNSVIRYASWACYQLSYPGDQAFFENVVFVESNSAVIMENGTHDMSCYFNGFYDALCYNTLNKICADKGYYVGMVYDDVNKTFDKYAEWFGKNNSGIIDVLKAMDERYVNPVLFDATAVLSNRPYFWNGESYVEENKDLVIALKIMGYYSAWTYNKTVEFDGGEMVGGYYTSRDMDRLFDSPGEIRLLCEFKGIDEKGNLIKNTDHILWHIHKVFRNASNIGDNDHIENLKKTLITTKDGSGDDVYTGITWADGSGVDASGMPYAPDAKPSAISAKTYFTVAAMEFNHILSCTILPKKEVA